MDLKEINKTISAAHLAYYRLGELGDCADCEMVCQVVEHAANDDGEQEGPIKLCFGCYAGRGWPT